MVSLLNAQPPGQASLPRGMDASQFEKVYPISENRARIKHEGKFGFVNAEGQVVIPPMFDRASDFKEGRAASI